MRTTNVAYRGQEARTLFIAEAEHGVIVATELPVADARMYGVP
jgi:hypothetical protein